MRKLATLLIMAILAILAVCQAADITVFRDGVSDPSLDDLPYVIFRDGVSQDVPGAAAISTNFPSYANTIVRYQMLTGPTQTDDTSIVGTNDATVSGTVYTTNGVMGLYPDFDTSTDKWTTDNSALISQLSGASAFTISYWFSNFSDDGAEHIVYATQTPRVRAYLLTTISGLVLTSSG